MSGKAHSKGAKLAAVVLARLAGVDSAAAAFDIDRRTIRGWLKREPVPEDSWAALDDLAGAQLLEQVALGKVKNPATLATVRGIASRNRRYAELIARREARREEADQPAIDTRTPTQQQIDRLDDSRRSLFVYELDYKLEIRVDAYDGKPREQSIGLPHAEDDALRWLTAQVDRLLALSDVEVAEQKEAWHAIFADAQAAMLEERQRQFFGAISEPAPEPPREQPSRPWCRCTR